MRSATRLATSALLVILGACSEPPTITGKVTDVWGKPLEGATVQVEGMTEHLTTGADGTFSFTAPDEGTRRLIAGKDGYLKNVGAISMPTDKDAPLPSPTIELYPEPPQPGFYAVNAKSLDHIEAVPIKTVGTELDATTGIETPGKVQIPANLDQRFIFRSTLRASELSRLGLQLHDMEFVTDRPVPGVTGATPVKVNLYVAKGTVAFDLKSLPTEDTYLLTPREKLGPGVYAFDTEGMLTTKDVDALDKTPAEMRVAYPFEIK